MHWAAWIFRVSGQLRVNLTSDTRVGGLKVDLVAIPFDGSDNRSFNRLVVAVNSQWRFLW